jgi:hypothetical protein
MTELLVSRSVVLNRGAAEPLDALESSKSAANFITGRPFTWGTAKLFYN